MPNLNGIEATRHIASGFPQIRIIGLSGYCDMLHVGGMLSAGASGYVLKECAFDELVEAIMAVCRGETYLCSKANQIVISEYIRLSSQNAHHLLGSLSAREREVLQLTAEGKTTKQIALDLHISTKTIEANRRAIMEKLGIHNIPELVKLAVREGLTPLE
jgi:DNA-binding NarL/FixJ family response regulator